MTSVTVASISISINPSEELSSFMNRIITSLRKLPLETDIVVFPEYCWGDNNINEISIFIESIKSDFHFNIIFGSHPFQLSNNKTTNNAIISIIDNKTRYSSKTVPMEGEKERNNIEPGTNTGVIDLSKVKIGILICADLWNWKLVRDLIVNQGAELLLVPAFTVVPKNHRAYAKYQWLSLAITRSREFVIPIVIADHYSNGEDYDVGAVSCVIDPSIKNENIKLIEDLIILPSDQIVTYTLNFDNINKYRDYRLRNGLLQR